ncbi:hypothetical protein YC2023_018166 [Brassica napus]
MESLEIVYGVVKIVVSLNVPTGKSSSSVADYVDLADQANHVNHADQEMQIKWIIQANQADQTVKCNAEELHVRMICTFFARPLEAFVNQILMIHFPRFSCKQYISLRMITSDEKDEEDKEAFNGKRRKPCCSPFSFVKSHTRQSASSHRRQDLVVHIVTVS